MKSTRARAADREAVKRTGGKALLPEVSAAAVAAVEPLRILAVSLAQATGEGIGPFGDGDEVDVVRHEAVSQQGYAVLGALRAEEVEIESPVFG